MLEESRRRLRTDRLDLWQIHGVSFENDPALFIRKNGAAEALEQAGKQGKVRFVGFTGHKDPSIHLKMPATGFPFDSVQMPLNAFDSHFHSFERQVLPELRRRGIAALGMKPICGHADPVQKGVLTGEEALRYAMSLPVTTTITGIDKPEILQQALKVALGFQPMTPAEMQALRDRCQEYAADGRFELYKLSLKFDNPEARLAHRFPLDKQSVEVKEMLQMTDNSGHPYPSAK
ncbi:MAG: aldo/keto reductase [Bryobacteraceae bacterium]|jgi:aryl-alcohol dehydrogenase-like predicted oxidoreductase